MPRDVVGCITPCLDSSFPQDRAIVKQTTLWNVNVRGPRLLPLTLLFNIPE